MDINELNALGFSSEYDAESTELALGIRFSDFTPEDRRIWRLQDLCLKQYALTPNYERAARRAGVTVADVKAWEQYNTLGFARRMEIAELEFSETVEVLLLELAKRPDSPTSLLLAFLKKHIPEEYGHIKVRRINGATRSKILRQVAEMHDRIVQERERLLDEEELLVRSGAESSSAAKVRALEQVSYWALDGSERSKNN